MVAKAIIFGAAILALGSCSQSPPNYCETEKRVIPELEWKARALVALRKAKEEDIPSEILALIEKRLPSGGTDAQVQKVFEEYVIKNPLCCQIDFKDRGNFLYFKEHNRNDLKAKASLIIYRDAGHDFLSLDEIDEYKRLGKIPRGGFGLKSVVGISPCGDGVVLWNRG